MATVRKSGLITPAMSASGRVIRLMARESLSMLMEILTMVCGLMIRPMAKELIRMPTVLSMTVSGWTTSSTDTAWNLGLMVPDMKETTSMARRRARGS